MKTTAHVLLVAEDPVVRGLVRSLLCSDGYQVSQAPDGRQALALLEVHCPDILVVDWMLPGLSGLDLCRQVREMRLPHHVYVVMLAARGASAELLEVVQAGADDFVNKAALREELLPRLRTGRRVRELERKLTALASTDSLTGLTARRAFRRLLDRELARAQRHRLPLSCVMLDIDDFQRVNDVHGPAAGDALLVAVAEVLRQNVRATDFACRYGGQEFCALLPHADEDAAAAWAERVRGAIAGLRVRCNGAELEVTASFGVAELLDDLRTSAQLIDQTDQALRVAKQSGRNRVVRYGALGAGRLAADQAPGKGASAAEDRLRSDGLKA